MADRVGSHSKRQTSQFRGKLVWIIVQYSTFKTSFYSVYTGVHIDYMRCKLNCDYDFIESCLALILWFTCGVNFLVLPLGCHSKVYVTKAQHE